MRFLFVLFCVLLTADAYGQQPAAAVSVNQPSTAAAYVGKPISAVVLMVEGKPLTDAMLLGLIESRAGTPLSMAAVRETIAHLYSLGRYQDVSVEAVADGGGVRVTYQLVPVHSVESLEFTGNLGLSKGQLRAAVVDRFSATPSAARAANVAEMLQNFYFDRGYLAAAIRPVVEVRHDPDATTLTFEIESGPRASIRNVIVEGDPLQPRERFLDRIHAAPGRIYQRVDVQEHLAEYVTQMHRQGRYEAQGSHRILAQSDDGQSVDLLVTVNAGPAISIRFDGDPLPKARLEELVPIRAEGTADVDIIEDSERRIASYLQQQGYWKAAATSARREVQGNIEIVFTVRQGLQYRIDGDVALSGNSSVPIDELRPALQNLEDGEVFTVANLEGALSSIRGIYLRRGFAQVKVESAVNESNPSPDGGGRVKPAIVITEGPLITVGAITFSGNADLSTDVLSARLGSRPGVPYYEPQVIQDRETVLTQYLNQGFATASVEVVPTMVDGSRLNIDFKVTEGPQSIIDHVLIVGNVKTDIRVIEREVQLQEGQPLGLQAMFDTRRRLGALGLFRRVRIEEIPHGESNRRDVLITVEEAPSTTIGYGGGLELSERLARDDAGAASSEYELAPRGFFEIGRRNIRGKNRSANLYTRLSLRSGFDDGGGQFSFPEYRVIGIFREPLTFGWNADVTLTGAVEQGVRSTFNFRRRGVTGELVRRLTPQVRVGARYTFSNTTIFDQQLTEEGDQATIDRVFPQVSLSAVGSSIARDTRDDALEPTRGYFMSAEASLASRFLGGQVGFVRSYLQAQGYRSLSASRGLVLASRIAIGLADGLPREVTTTGPSGVPITQTIEDLPASERFFAGGDTTVRGFPLDSLGTARTLTPAGFPRGGNGLVLLNAELRFPVWGKLAGGVFVDAGNVFERVTQIEVGELRTTAGFGLRYRSPVGPLRLDVGFKLDRRPYGDSDRQAFHFSFGHAF
ncbi:MAG TPA: POTRA domain-containing protein [Vicinamibacterales bacterium]|nr:POTRA domain-containing protein [Vicinamibacterales bacterium]